jgi:hypothetical protein
MRTYDLVLDTDARAPSTSEIENQRRHLLKGEPLVAPHGGPGRWGIRCRLCGFVSWHPLDVQHRYCVMCHHFHEENR